MRWKYKPKPDPEFGDTKIVKRFAFLPKLCKDDTVVWLEFYWAVMKYGHNTEYTYWFCMSQWTKENKPV